MPQNGTLGKPPHSKYFNAFCVYPKAKFESQNSGEKIILLLRAHPATQLPWVIASFAAFFLPLILNLILPDFLSFSQIFFMNFFWYSILLTYIFLKILFWLFNVGIVTDERILDIDYLNVVQKTVNATTLEEAADVGSKVNGFIRSLFNYGDVYVQTAGPTQDIEFLAVPEPTEVVSIINELMH